MHTTGKIHELNRTLEGKLILGLEIPYTEKNISDIENLMDKELNVDIKRYSAHRSNNANRLFWKMCDEIARALNTTQDAVHDMLIRDWGIKDNLIFLKDRLGAFALTFDIVEVLDEFYEGETLMVEARCYVGSRFYNRSEMAYLLDHTLEQAKELGINTFDEAECERLVAEWEARSR